MSAPQLRKRKLKKVEFDQNLGIKNEVQKKSSLNENQKNSLSSSAEIHNRRKNGKIRGKKSKVDDSDVDDEFDFIEGSIAYKSDKPVENNRTENTLGVAKKYNKIQENHIKWVTKELDEYYNKKIYGKPIKKMNESWKEIVRRGKERTPDLSASDAPKLKYRVDKMIEKSTVTLNDAYLQIHYPKWRKKKELSIDYYKSKKVDDWQQKANFFMKLGGGDIEKDEVSKFSLVDRPEFKTWYSLNNSVSHNRKSKNFQNNFNNQKNFPYFDLRLQTEANQETNRFVKVEKPLIKINEDFFEPYDESKVKNDTRLKQKANLEEIMTSFLEVKKLTVDVNQIPSLVLTKKTIAWLSKLARIDTSLSEGFESLRTAVLHSILCLSSKLRQRAIKIMGKMAAHVWKDVFDYSTVIYRSMPYFEIVESMIEYLESVVVSKDSKVAQKEAKILELRQQIRDNEILIKKNLHDFQIKLTEQKEAHDYEKLALNEKLKIIDNEKSRMKKILLAKFAAEAITVKPGANSNTYLQNKLKDDKPSLKKRVHQLAGTMENLNRASRFLMRQQSKSQKQLQTINTFPEKQKVLESIEEVQHNENSEGVLESQNLQISSNNNKRKSTSKVLLKSEDVFSKQKAFDKNSGRNDDNGDERNDQDDHHGGYQGINKKTSLIVREDSLTNDNGEKPAEVVQKKDEIQMEEENNESYSGADNQSVEDKPPQQKQTPLPAKVSDNIYNMDIFFDNNELIEELKTQLFYSSNLRRKAEQKNIEMEKELIELRDNFKNWKKDIVILTKKNQMMFENIQNRTKPKNFNTLQAATDLRNYFGVMGTAELEDFRSLDLKQQFGSIKKAAMNQMKYLNDLASSSDSSQIQLLKITLKKISSGN